MISTFDTAYLCFFCDKFIRSGTFAFDKSFNCSNSFSQTHSLISLNKPSKDKASQIDILTNKPDNSGQHDHTMSSYTDFDFESVLS